MTERTAGELQSCLAAILSFIAGMVFNAYLSFLQVLTGSHLYAMADHGSLIVAVKNAIPTDVLL